MSTERTTNSPRKSSFCILHSSFCILLALAIVAFLSACSRRDAATPTTPSPPPTGDFPAFGGGGELHNLAPAIAAPPMKVRWTFTAFGGFNAAPVIVGDSVYAATASGDLLVLDLASGQKRWMFHSEAGFDATPLVDGEVVYIGDMAGTFFGIDAATGKQAWSVDAKSAVHAGANCDNGRIFFGTDAGLILCLDRTGKTLWTAQADGRINAPPAIQNGLAAFSSCDAHLHTLRIADGKEIFKTNLENVAPGSACAGDKSFFVGTDQGHVLALSIQDGTTQWNFDKIADAAMVYASPALWQDTLIVAARDSNVYALNATDGSRKWMFATGAEIDASPVISDGRVYVPSKDRRLYVLNLADGKSLWTFEAAQPVSAPVAIGRGVLVMGDAGGTLYCLEGQ